MPIAHKDIFCTSGVKTTCGSRMLDNFISPYDATLVAKLKAAGAVMLGKANMDEFAMGSSNETSYYGPVRNPWNTALVPGGSSGGSAATVAARLAPLATATDTGRLDPSARRTVWSDRTEAYVWTRIALWNDRVRIQSRPGWDYHRDSGGCGAGPA